MTKKKLFRATKKEVVTATAEKLFQAKLTELQKERTIQIAKIKEEVKKQNKNRLFKVNAKDRLKSADLTPKFTIRDLADYYCETTGTCLNAETMSDILQGKATIANQKIDSLKVFLGDKFPKELFFLIFPNDIAAMNYEHDLFFNILEDAKKQIFKYIPSTFRGNNVLLMTKNLALGEWGTTRIDQAMNDLINEVWKQTTLLNKEGWKVNELIKYSDQHPEKSDKNMKMVLYDHMFDMIKSIYKQIFQYDLAPAFPHDCFRFQTYNQLDNLNRKHIQDHAVMNLVIIAHLTSGIIHNIPDPMYQWNNNEGRIYMLRAISKYLVQQFKYFSTEYGNDFKLNAFK